MNKTYCVAASLALMIAGMVTGCKDSAQPAAPATKPAVAQKATHDLPNYRYVDLDTVLSRYNLAKDYNEEMLRMQTNMESAYKSHQNKIQNFAANMQKKLQNNTYLSESSYKADEQALGSMQNEAQNAMTRLQSQLESSAIKAQQAVNDSIEKFIAEYNKTRGYDAIFVKASTLYINPDLDITNEVVEGLNARYNKVKK